MGGAGTCVTGTEQWAPSLSAPLQVLSLGLPSLSPSAGAEPWAPCSSESLRPEPSLPQILWAWPHTGAPADIALVLQASAAAPA